MKHSHLNSASAKKFLSIASAGLILALASSAATAQVTPGGTLGDKAIIIDATGGEQLTAAAAAGALGPVLVHSFDTGTIVDASYELNPTGVDATQIALSSGRHLVMYDTRFDATAGANRSEIQTILTLDEGPLVAGRSQGYIRRTGGANEAVLSGGAIITVGADNDILTIESRRSDTNADASVLPTRIANGTAVQLLKLDDTWDYLSLELVANQAGVNTATFVDVAYDTNASPATLGTAFSVAGGNITLNESGLYLVFANTSIEKVTNNTRTNYQQRLTLDGSPVAGSTTTTYVRGNEDTNEGVATLGMVLSATAGQVLNVEVNKEVGTNGVIQGGETALSMIKLPATAASISLLDTTNQEVNDAALDPLNFATQVDVPSLKFGHSPGTSEVTVNEDADYLFFGTVFTSSDTTNDNQDRTVPLHGWQIDNTGGRIPRGRGAQYNRDNGARTSGSWGAAIIPLLDEQTVQLATERLGNGDTGMAGTTIALQGLSIKSLVPSNDPVIVNNGQLSLLVSTSGTITTGLLNAVDADDTAADLTYTVTSTPTLGTLKNGVATVAVLGTFTQADIDAGNITFEARPTPGTGGFTFSIEDDSGSGTEANGTFVVGVGETTALTADTGTTGEDTVLMAVDNPGPSVLDNDSGTALAVSAADSSSAQGATVTIDAAGNISYDPTTTPSLQALDDGEQIVDSFTYTVTDFSFTNFVGDVNITVNGANDDPVVVDDATTGTDSTISTINVLANDTDVDAGDTLTVVSINGNPVGLAGLTTLTNEEGTVTILPDGSLTYDPSTSGDIGALNNGGILVDTITYEVSDGTSTVGGTITITSVGSFGASNDLGILFLASSPTTTFGILGNDDLLGAAGTATAGAAVEFLATNPSNTATEWFNSGTTSATTPSRPVVGGAASVLNLSPNNTPVGVTAVYQFSGSGSGLTLLDAGDPNFGDTLDVNDATIELVFRPADQVGNVPLWETGGNGTGSSIVLLGNKLVATISGNGPTADIAQVVAPLPADSVAGGSFVHVAMAINTDPSVGAGSLELFVNGVSLGSDTLTDLSSNDDLILNDWSGTDDGGVGLDQGTVGGDTATASFLGANGTTPIVAADNQRFAGEVASLRIYGSVLTPEELAANVAAIFGTTSAPGIGDIIDIAGETTLAPLPKTINLPSGAIATLNADGTITYDPNGAFDHIATGLEGVDSFQYTLSGGPPATATVIVRIFGNNTDPQVTIAADQTSVTEGGVAGFTLTAASNVASDVTVDLSYTGTAADGTDYSSQASVVISSGTATADLDLTTIADSLFENAAETIIVTIDSVTGPATLGATTSAAMTIIDGDSAPVFTISGPGPNVTEGSAGPFTVTASVASAAAITLDVAYSGTADASDYNATPQVTIPAAATSGDLNIVPFDDGIADPGETVTATFSNPSIGSMGAPDNASFTIIDGSGVIVFMADFEGVDPVNTPGGTLLNADAPFAADLGTAIGTWNNVPIGTSAGSAPGVFTEGGADVKGDGVDSALRLDRPLASGAAKIPGEGDTCAQFDGAIDISGSNSGVISFDLGSRRTQNTSLEKSTRIIGLDDAGNKSFELFVDANNSGALHEQLFHVDSAGTLTPLGNPSDFENTTNFNENRMSNLRLLLTSTGYSVAIDVYPLGATATPETVTGELAYAGSATVVSRILFLVSTSTNTNISGGIYIDDVTVSGTRLSKREAWRKVYFGSTANSGDAADSNDFNCNGFTNLQDFALGFDPVAPGSGGGAISVANAGTGGTIINFGTPTIWVDPSTDLNYLRYARRADFVALGLSIIEQFGSNMDLPADWEDSAVPAEVIAQGLGDGNVHVEVLQTEFPAVLPISGGTGRFGRVHISLDP